MMATRLWKTPHPWKSAKTRIPTAAWKSLRLYHVSHRFDGEGNSLLESGIFFVVRAGILIDVGQDT